MLDVILGALGAGFFWTCVSIVAYKATVEYS